MTEVVYLPHSPHGYLPGEYLPVAGGAGVPLGVVQVVGQVPTVAISSADLTVAPGCGVVVLVPAAPTCALALAPTADAGVVVFDGLTPTLMAVPAGLGRVEGLAPQVALGHVLIAPPAAVQAAGQAPAVVLGLPVHEIAVPAGRVRVIGAPLPVAGGTLAADLAGLLHLAGHAVLGDSLFVNAWPDDTAWPDRLSVGVFELTGRRLTRRFDTTSEVAEARVLVRAGTFAEAATVAQEIAATLDTVRDVLLTGTWYRAVRCGTPQQIGRTLWRLDLTVYKAVAQRVA